MKKTINIFIITLLSLIPVLSFGQYAEQAIRLSNLNYNGTARFTGMGGAFGAIGGDFTTLSINPAGIGVYKNCEVAFTPSIYNTRSFSKYFETKQEEFNTRMNLNNVGFIFAAEIPNNDFRAFQFGIGYNRLVNYNNSIYFEGFNPSSTFTKALADVVTRAYENNNFYPEDPLYADELAAAVNLLDYDPLTKRWYSDMSRNVNQRALLQTEGGIDEMVFTFGGNYQDKLYFGVTVGLPFMSYWHSYQYNEWSSIDVNNFRSMLYEERYESDGVGINGKFGVIYKPVSFFRIGAAIHTPTYYWNIQESEWLRMSSSFYDSIQWDKTATTPERLFEYSQTVPMRVIGSVAFVPTKFAVISADYEWVDHSMNKMQPSYNADINAENQYLKDFYKSQHIVRTGAELRWSNVYFRGGYGWYSSPYQDEKVNDMSVNTWSLGIGVRTGSFGIDFAYQHARSHSKYYPYNLYEGYSPYASMNNNANSYMMTFSYRY